MAGARPEQAILTRDTDMTKTSATRSVIENMVDGLNDHRISDIGEFFCRKLPLDRKPRVRHKKRTARFSGKLAKTFSGSLFR